MYLSRIQLQGFKTFAKRTTLDFLGPKTSLHPITAIVGPNGSGKSNIADAIRWVLGEQSSKVIRAKESADVIFSGSQNKTRSSMAEVILTLDNQDGAMPIEFSEVSITRRLFRDGTSEYLLNDKTVRLMDVRLLLAQANVGQRSYSVIGQGMVDHILVASPDERKSFFDDATGVKPLQIKRHEAVLKLKRTYENMGEVELLLSEIRPRLNSLRRQAKKLEQRAYVEQELRQFETQFYTSLWWQLQDETDIAQNQHKTDEGSLAQKKRAISDLEKQILVLETEVVKEQAPDEELIALQKSYATQQTKMRQARDERFRIQKNIELEKVRAQSAWAPLPLGEIIRLLKNIKAELEKESVVLTTISGHLTELLARLTKPNPDEIKTDPKLLHALKEAEEHIAFIEKELEQTEQAITSYSKAQKNDQTKILFAVQRELRERERDLHQEEARRTDARIELARLEERRISLEREMKEHAPVLVPVICATRPVELPKTQGLYSQIQKLRETLAHIGGIDPEILTEFEQTKTRYEFLEEQMLDLTEAIKSTENLVDELDREIKMRGEKTFKEINKQFQHFFHILFDGGSCELVKVSSKELENETPQTLEQEQQHHEHDSLSEQFKRQFKEKTDRIVGIDIHATPPGKKLKALDLLSGGERALTSIALVSAIMAVNPAPFVVLDEVDAALDEANTVRFAHILTELQKLTQFIVITHNRATMEKADVLYGVTMGDEGISHLLSVKLEEVAQGGTTRR